MDIKALMQKLAVIDTKQTLTEGAVTELDKKTLGSYIKKATSPSDERSIANLSSKAAWKLAGDGEDDGTKDDHKSFLRSKGIARAATKLTKEDVSFKGGIANALLREFNLAEAETVLTPAQLKILGGANQQDPYIIARNLGVDAVPLSYFKDPEDIAIAKKVGFKDVAPTSGTSGQAVAPAVNNGAQRASATTDPIPDLQGQLDKAAADDKAAEPAVAPAAGTSGQAAGNDILKAQQELKAAGANLGSFGANKDGVDGKMGRVTAAALLANKEIAAKYPALAAQAKSIAAKPAVAPAAKPAVAPAAKPATGQTFSNGETGRVEISSAVAAKQAEIDDLVAQQKQFPGRSQIGADIEYKQQELAALQKKGFSAAAIPGGQTTQQSLDAGKQQSISVLQQKLAAAKSPQEKQAIQTAIDRVKGMSLPGSTPAPSREASGPITQVQAGLDNPDTPISEDDSILSIIRGIKY